MGGNVLSTNLADPVAEVVDPGLQKISKFLFSLSARNNFFLQTVKLNN